jgi:bifunctional UDP-N-acetylglucosamine pyrophosphorylase/glucosamine-1-phosphate N-acetyltransferase
MPQLGTGHAVQQALAELHDEGTTLILSGDVPLLDARTAKALVESCAGQRLALLTIDLPDPTGYGRIIRQGDSVQGIVEQKDATPAQREIHEVYTGMMAAPTAALRRWLSRLTNNNAQGEYYLTDLIAVARDAGKNVGAVIVADPIEAIGVNSRAELATVEGEIQRRVVNKLMAEGVTFRNPATVVIDSTVTIGADSVVYPFVTLEGTTRIGEGCVVEPGVHLVNCTVGDDVHLKSGTVAEESIIEDEASVGPYAHLRPGTRLGKHVKVGNFVETKKAVFGEGAKASHLSYIGDAEVGADANIGAGTITCNYDGVQKHKTIIEDGAFIGSDSQLVAPVRVGKGAYVAAGSTITKDVPADSLALSRTPQRVIAGWAARRREEQKKNR